MAHKKNPYVNMVKMTEKHGNVLSSPKVMGREIIFPGGMISIVTVVRGSNIARTVQELI